MNLEQFLILYKEDISNLFDEADMPHKDRNKIISALLECFGIMELPLESNDLLSIISTLAEGAYEVVKDEIVSIDKSDFVNKIDAEIEYYVDEEVYQEYINNRKSNK